MKVHIDDLFAVECVSIAGWWNGWARPLFTREQLDGVRDALVASGGLLYDFDGEEIADSANTDMTTLEYVTRWDDLYEVCGWIWQVLDEQCQYCGYMVDPTVTCECGAVS